VRQDTWNLAHRRLGLRWRPFAVIAAPAHVGTGPLSSHGFSTSIRWRAHPSFMIRNTHSCNPSTVTSPWREEEEKRESRKDCQITSGSPWVINVCAPWPRKAAGAFGATIQNLQKHERNRQYYCQPERDTWSVQSGWWLAIVQRACAVVGNGGDSPAAVRGTSAAVALLFWGVSRDGLSG
jgi:hypothetical protein